MDERRQAMYKRSHDRQNRRDCWDRQCPNCLKFMASKVNAPSKFNNSSDDVKSGGIWIADDSGQSCWVGLSPDSLLQPGFDQFEQGFWLKWFHDIAVGTHGQ